MRRAKISGKWQKQLPPLRLSEDVETNPLVFRATISHVFFSVTYSLDIHKITREVYGFSTWFLLT